MVKPSDIQPKLVVEELLEQWPETIPVFIRHGMACVGCDMSRFETIESAAGIYRLDMEELVKELKEAAG